VNHAIVLWDAGTGKERPPVGGRHDAVVAVAPSPDGKTLATAEADGAVRLWEEGSGKVRSQVSEGRAGDAGPRFVAFTPDGKRLAFRGAGGAVVLWDAEAGREVRRIGGTPDEPFGCAALSPDGKTLAVADGKNRIRLIDAAGDGKDVFLEGHEKRIVCLAFSPDGRTLASAGEDDSLRVWRLGPARSLERATKVEVRGVTAVGFAPGGKLLATGDEEDIIGLWDAATGKEVRRLFGHPGPVFALAFSPDGCFLASGGYDHAVRLWETASGQEALQLTGHEGSVRAVAFSPDGRTLYSGSDDGVALAWDLTGRSKAAVALTPAALDNLWEDLVSDEGPAAYRAFWRLAGSPAQGVPYVRDRLKPFVGADARRIARLIADLNDDEFTVREKASAELEKLGQAAAPALKQVTANSAPAEVHRRVEELLGKLTTAVPWERERRRVLRALAVLEKSGDPAARKLLEEAADGAFEAELRQAAREALDRLPAAPKP
jgi:Tol biopolymer transport system component